MTIPAIISFVLGNSTLFMIGGGAIAAFVAFKVNGRKQFKAGVRKTVREYREIDEKGAGDARIRAETVLNRIDNVDTDELLDSTNGFRD